MPNINYPRRAPRYWNFEHSNAMASHRGRNSAYDKFAQIFFWHNIAADINEHVKSCEECQKQDDLKLKLKSTWSRYQYHPVWWNRLEWISVTFQKSMGILMSFSWLTSFQNGWNRNRLRTNQLRLSLDFCTSWCVSMGTLKSKSATKLGHL